MSRIDFLRDQWDKLAAKTKQKTQKLKEASQELQFNTAAKDMDFWLAEVSRGPVAEPQNSRVL